MEGIPSNVIASKKKFNVSSITMTSMLGYMFISPTFIALIALVFYPLLYGIYISFFKTDLASNWNFIGIKNFIDLFQNVDFVRQLGVTFEFTIAVVVAHFVIGILLALILNKPRKGIKFFRTILVLPWLFPDVVVALIFKWIMNPLYGLFNYWLMEAGFIHDNVAWLSDTKYALISVIVVAVWKGYPFIMMNVLAGLQSISQDLYEASTIDGANRIQIFRYITLPSLRPVLVTSVILDTIWWFKHYTIVELLTKGGPGDSTSIISIAIFRQAFEFFNFGSAAAMSVIVFIICYLITILYRRILDNED